MGAWPTGPSPSPNLRLWVIRAVKNQKRAFLTCHESLLQVPPLSLPANNALKTFLGKIPDAFLGHLLCGVPGQCHIIGTGIWPSHFPIQMVLGACTLLPMLLTISLKTCSRQHLNYFKPYHPFLTHISYPASNIWQGCENHSVRTTAALFLDSDKQPSTWNPLKMVIFIHIYIFF